MPDPHEARQMLDLAARLAWRGWGHVEPNPLVGCVLVRAGSGPARDRIIGMGHHRRFGGIHAEVDALENARLRGRDPSGATAYVTLEPCSTQGKQPACTTALTAAKIGRVVCARRDPHPKKGGGAEQLARAGIPVEFSEASHNAIRLSDPFVKRVKTSRPWVIVKWAQTIDGKIATSTGDSKWISSERSRRWVHLTRARVDAILTGIGTVKADDPQFNARDVPLRRVAAKVVLDPAMELTPQARLWEGGLAKRVLTFVAAERLETDLAQMDESSCFGGGFERSTIAMGSIDGAPDLARVMDRLFQNHIFTVLCECGPGFTSQLWAQHLVDELHVYVAPKLVGDIEAKGPLRGFHFESISSVPHMDLCLAKRIGGDMLLVYRRPHADGA